MLKQHILNTIDFVRTQIENDKCTAEELRSASDMFVAYLQVDATAHDIADFYHRTDGDVRTALSRNFHKEKPKRKVLYNFAWVSKIVPKTWRH
jgi:hypothetical protein